MANGTDRRFAGSIRPCEDGDRLAILHIVGAAAEAYRAAIPPDCWHEPYMEADELQADIADGVAFSGFEVAGELVGVMGLQPRGNVALIRHAYVLPSHQDRGVGSALLDHLRRRDGKPLLVGTWRAAAWAIRFYERHGFAPVPTVDVAPLLRCYWTVPDRQIEASLVLAAPPLPLGAAAGLIAAARRR